MDTSNSLYHTPNTGPEPEPEAEPAKPVQKRRRFSIEQKRHIVEDALASGDSFSIAARRHNINTNLLFKWRQQYEQGQLEPVAEAPNLVPITLASGDAEALAPHQDRFRRSARLEIVLPNGHRLTVIGNVCADALRTTLECLSP
ncbi:IS66-like element accessory protein TnpA [Pseudohalioglobus lutimaris]|uniref:Transposase n=1 Tax=Pseudohalioglobus lutimaris TaxID=1737061 RepID=A0A2N5WX23_9GAMM|nr:transposase [Pseudohalioglobus lutimaris]PLW66785.1 hypothetical protein C0039_20000 [Pseudohalioglobus lutimaris]